MHTATAGSITLTQAIKAEALRLGFTFIGVTTPDRPQHWGVYENWLAQGRHGEMAYLQSERSRQRRADPRQILPECRSILVLGVYYDPASSDDPAAAGEETALGRIAAYAWGADYHDVLPPRLRALVSFIEEAVGGDVPNRWYTDSGPLLERDLAQRAGLGWIGKNTCLIQPGGGSYFLLAEILLGIELDVDTPFSADYCGACTRCIDACPTDCILPDRTLDARRCLSYLTIELKGPIPLDLRPRLGNWVFGCDICQQVCPWNIRFAPPHGDPEFSSPVAESQPALLAEIALSPPAFSQKYKNSPVKRAKRGGYLRNVAVALGNRFAGSGNGLAVEALAQALLHDPEPLVRGHAAWALGQVGGSAEVLAQAARAESDPYVLGEIQAARKLINPNWPETD